MNGRRVAVGLRSTREGNNPLSHRTDTFVKHDPPADAKRWKSSTLSEAGMNLSSVALPAILAALASGVFALVGVIVTSALAQRREHEADWRQTKIEHYQEYVTALSNIVSGRSTPAAQERYADAVNALALVASPAVLDAVNAFQQEISYRNTARSDARHDVLLSEVMHAMRRDLQPHHVKNPRREFHFLAPPPASTEAEADT